jgi:hypothetical protein
MLSVFAYRFLSAFQPLAEVTFTLSPGGLFSKLLPRERPLFKKSHQHFLE